VLGRRTNEVTVEKVMGNGQVLDLLRRAVMAEFVLAALPEIEARKPEEINLARVYLYAVRRQMEENITTGRTFTSLADKLYFLCELSWEMLSTDRMSLNYREFPDLLRKFFGAEVESQKDLDHWHYDMMGQTMLVRNEYGDYSPAHKSLLEFFAAYKIAAELGLLHKDFLEIAQQRSDIDRNSQPQSFTWSTYWQRTVGQKDNPKLITGLFDFTSESPESLRNTFGKYKLSLFKTVLTLLLPMLKSLDEVENHLLSLIDFTKDKSANDIGYLGGNAATVLVKRERTILSHKNLDYTNLCGADFNDARMVYTDLIGADMSETSLSKTFASINAIAVISNQQKLVTAHDDNIIRIWDQKKGLEILELCNHKEKVCDIVLSKNGDSLYSCSQDGTIRKWNTQNGSGKEIFKLNANTFAKVLALSSDEKFLCFGDNIGLVIKINLKTPNPLPFEIGKHDQGVNAIVLSPDDTILYSGGNESTVKVWDVMNGLCLKEGKSNLQWIKTISLSSDGKFLYTAGGNETIDNYKLASEQVEAKKLASGEIETWTIDSDFHIIHTFKGHKSWVNKIILSLDGNSLYSCDTDGYIKCWDVVNRKCLKTFDRCESWVNALALDLEEGKILYSGGNDLKISLWDLETGNRKDTFDGQRGLIRTITITNDGKYVYSGSHNCVIKKFTVENELKMRFEGHTSWVRTIILNQDESRLYSGSDDNTIRIWDTIIDNASTTNNVVTIKSLELLEGHQGSVRSLILSSDGQSLYSGSDDHTIKIWRCNPSNGKWEFQQTLRGHKGSVRSLILSPNGQFLYSGSDDCSIRMWRISDHTLLLARNHHTASVRSLVISSDNHFVYSGSEDRTIQRWRVQSDGSLSHEKIINGDYQSVINTMCLSMDNKSIYVGGDDSCIKQLSVSDGTYQKIFKGHQGCINAISLCLNEKQLCSGSNDRTVKMWDTKTGTLLKTIDTRIFAGTKIAHVKGLSESQIKDFVALGATNQEPSLKMAKESEFPSDNQLN
jgi:WD40 repeat protein